MAFIHTPCCTAMESRSGNTSKLNFKSSCQTSRREILTFLTTSVCYTMLPKELVFAEEKPQLPPGAQQFNRLLAARSQWKSLSEVVNGSRTIEDSEWDSLRQYIRTVYAVSGDMEFIAKPWDKELKQRANSTIKQFRQTVKGMDKPAINRDLETFAKAHSETTALFDEFFAELKQATISDIPDEL